MFLCDDCHKSFGEGHLSRSHGPCEGCGKTADCSDCHCPPRKPTLPELTTKPKSGPFLHQKPCQILVHRRTIESGGYPPHHPIWKFLTTLPTAILDGYAGVMGDTCIWFFPGYVDKDGSSYILRERGRYSFYILREHGQEWKFKGRRNLEGGKGFGA